MRAHFAGDIPMSTDSADGGDIDRIEKESLEIRIDEFKKDPKNMKELTEFIDDVLQTAEGEALKKQTTKSSQQQPKEKSRQSFAMPDFKNAKVVNRARGFAVRLFDAICNCANTAAAPAVRIKLRGKRSSTGGEKRQSNGNEKKESAKQQRQCESVDKEQ